MYNLSPSSKGRLGSPGYLVSFELQEFILSSNQKWVLGKLVQAENSTPSQISAAPADFHDALAPRNHNYSQVQGRGVIRPIPLAQQSLGLSLQG